MSTQVTADSILRDAYQNRDRPLERPEQTIQDLDELRSFQLTKRREYEQQLNKNRLNFGQWVRYAKWEVEYNHDFQRARSVYERALQVNVEHIPFWIHYIQLELTNKNVNHARNLLERAVTSLPRVDKFWYLYVQTEETLGNYDMVRVIFERWLTWHPSQSSWDSFIGFERRYEEYENARVLYSRYVERFNYSGEVWLKWIQFEIRQAEGYERSVFENAIDSMILAWQGRLSTHTQENQEDVFFANIIDKWTRWEVSAEENQRARAIYVKLLEIIHRVGGDVMESKGASLIQQQYTEFEKIYGNQNSIEESIYSKRLVRYKIELESDPNDYDTWWAYIKLTQKVKSGSNEEICKIFENAIENVPKNDTVKSIRWKRYIYLWIHYALYVEFNLLDVEAARTIWNRCIQVVPKNRFVFGKVWILFAEFEIRNGGGTDINSARKILGRSIGVCSSIGKAKSKIFRFYISLEKKLGEWGRCRKIYEKWLELDTSAASVLLEYINFERELGETLRVIGLFEIGMELNFDSIWKLYVSYLQEETEYGKAREVYRRVINSNPPKSGSVWIAFAMFESRIPTEEQLRLYEAGGNDNDNEDDEIEFSITDIQRNNTRSIFKEALMALKQYPEQRITVLEAYKYYEENQGTPESIQEATKKLPTAVTKRRTNSNGIEEEYVEFIFPEDEQRKPEVSKFLANAKKWMLQNKS